MSASTRCSPTPLGASSRHAAPRGARVGATQARREGHLDAEFSATKTLDDFELRFQPSVDQKLVRELATGRLIANAENVVLFGPPGVGKTHLAIALGGAARLSPSQCPVRERHGAHRRAVPSRDRRPPRRAPMTIHAGTICRYYKCSDRKKRGTCGNKLSLREDVAKDRLLEALETRLTSPAAILYLRKRIAEKLGATSRGANAELAERRARLERTEERIAGLVHFISNGDQSEAVRKTLLDLEAQAKAETQAITDIKHRAATPITLPTPDFVLRQMGHLRRAVETDPLRAREQLRAMFEDGQLLLHPQPGGFYEAESKLFPLRFLRFAAATATAGAQKSKDHRSEDLWSSSRCAGRI